MAGDHEIKFEYNYIADGIYIGTNQCCQTHFDETLKNKEGITAEISLEKDRIDAPFGIDFYVWIPIENHTAPTEDQLNFWVAVLEKLLEMKRKVYVHCQYGHGRAPTMVAAYYIKQGKSIKEAIELIKKQRPTIHIEEIQKKALEEYKRKISSDSA